MTVRASKSAVPFMLMLAPRGSTKRATASLMPCWAAQRSVTGNVAMLESVPKTVISACANALQHNGCVFGGISLLVYTPSWITDPH